MSDIYERALRIERALTEEAHRLRDIASSMTVEEAVDGVIAGKREPLEPRAIRLFYGEDAVKHAFDTYRDRCDRADCNWCHPAIKIESGSILSRDDKRDFMDKAWRRSITEDLAGAPDES